MPLAWLADDSEALSKIAEALLRRLRKHRSHYVEYRVPRAAYDELVATANLLNRQIEDLFRHEDSALLRADTVSTHRRWASQESISPEQAGQIELIGAYLSAGEESQ